jgi:WD40 repeat protein/energy-coupling factor transporter ATP-binding protein EcfA2
VAEGHEVFLDRDSRDGVVVGEGWEQRLHERLRWADAVVCVVTSAAVASTWCTAEVSIALSRGGRVLPVRAETGVVHPLLTSAQYADLIGDADAARVALVEALRRVDAVGGLGWPDDRSPFRGLRPLEVKDHRVFFGRNSEVQRLAGLVRSPAERAEGAVLVVVGPSGCGKSSLVRAGLLHVMASEPGWWTLPAILPGADPVAVLARELAGTAQQLSLNWTVAKVGHQLRHGGLRGLVDELLLAARARRLLVVVDQFEELLTQTPPAQRARFAQLLTSVLRGPVQVVATLRPEFLDQLLVNAELAVLPTRTDTLRPLSREALRAVIEGPARLAGITIAEDLVARLVADTDSGEALPLLAFTLAQLAEGVSRGGQLSRARYDQLGGVQGALSGQADAALAEAIAVTGRGRAEVIAGLLRLVTVDEQGRPTRWRVPRVELPKAVIREADVFVTRRLLTTDTDNGSVVVGVAHEALLSAWPPLAEAITAGASALRARRAVEQAATAWHDEDRCVARLWERGQLAAALADTGARLQSREVVTDHVDLSPTARAFLHASIRKDRLRRGRALTILSVLLTLALSAAGYAFTQQHTAVAQRDLALSRQAADQALALRATNPALAAQLALAAYRHSPNAETRSSLLSTSADHYATRLTSHTATVKSVGFSPDGHILTTAGDDQTTILWDLRNPHHPSLLATLTGHTSHVWSLSFSPDGHTLATSSKDNTAKLWGLSDLHHPGLLATLTGHTSGVNSVSFSPNGRTLATASRDGTAKLWDLSNRSHPSLLATLTGHTGYVNSVGFSPDGHTLATASEDNTAKLWDLSDLHHPGLLATLTGHTSEVWSVGFSPDGHTLATSSKDNTAKLWDLSDPHHPALLTTLTGHTSYVYSVGFSPDGHTLATSSEDNTAKLWDLSDPHHPALLTTLTGHTSEVWSVGFSPDGHTLATASGDNTTRLWDLPGPIAGSHTDGLSSVSFSPDGHTLATASEDNTAKLWDLSDPHHPGPSLLATLTGHTSGVNSVGFSPDGHTLATASRDGTARLWDLSDPHHPSLVATLTGHTTYVHSVGFSPDGHTLATASEDNTAKLWDLSDPHHPALLTTLTSHTSFVWSVGFSPDGRILATGSYDGTAKVWDLRDLRHPGLLASLTGHTSGVNSVSFSPDGHTLATASRDGTARLWDLRNPHHPSLLATLTGHTSTVDSVSFSPDGHTLATASRDGTARLWDLRDLRHPGLLASLTGHTSGVDSVSFSPDGHTLATASRDGTARLWETNPGNAAARICATAWPTITTNEWSHYLPGLTYQPSCP